MAAVAAVAAAAVAAVGAVAAVAAAPAMAFTLLLRYFSTQCQCQAEFLPMPNA